MVKPYYNPSSLEFVLETYNTSSDIIFGFLFEAILICRCCWQHFLTFLLPVNLLVVELAALPFCTQLTSKQTLRKIRGLFMCYKPHLVAETEVHDQTAFILVF
jgi:hypothetical protein